MSKITKVQRAIDMLNQMMNDDIQLHLDILCPLDQTFNGKPDELQIRGSILKDHIIMPTIIHITLNNKMLSMFSHNEIAMHLHSKIKRIIKTL